MDIIENINNKFNKKIKILKQILTIIQSYKQNAIKLEKEIKNIENDFVIHTDIDINELENNKYASNENANNQILEKYVLSFLSYHFEDRANNIYKLLKHKANKYHLLNGKKEYVVDNNDNQKEKDQHSMILKNELDDNTIEKISYDESKLLSKYISDYTKIKIDIDQRLVKYDYCPNCNIKMIVYAETSIMMCSKCGHVINLCGTICEEKQYVNQETSKVRNKGYKERDHFLEWLNRVFAVKDKFEFDLEKFKQIKERVELYTKKYSKVIKCDTYRLVLKELKYSEYNKHIPALRYKHIGYAPPQLTDKELDEVLIDFRINNEIFQRIKPNDRRSSCYYGYQLYKIIHNKFINYPDKRDKILECIHIQKQKTYIADDIIYEQICAEREKRGDFSFKYYPTIPKNEWNF